MVHTELDKTSKNSITARPANQMVSVLDQENFPPSLTSLSKYAAHLIKVPHMRVPCSWLKLVRTIELLQSEKRNL
jgi:hypothetical protein